MAATVQPNSMSANYETPPDSYDEAFVGKSCRKSWQEVWKRIESLGPDTLMQRADQAAQLLDEHDVTYGSVSQGSQSRHWKLDLIPMILKEATWKQIEAGVNQRARLYNLIIQDLYGPRNLLQQKILPAEIVFAHSNYLHVAQGLHQSRQSLTCYGVELARSQDGKFWVMADRSDAPAGMGYTLENRIVTRRMLPQLSQDIHIRKLSPFYSTLRETLKSLSPRSTEHPRIVLLSGGPGTPFYFEDIFLARYLGYDLAQGSDLAVRGDKLFLKTLAGLISVDVVFLRGSESEVDPVECGGGAPYGVPGLLQAIRSGNVAAVNTPGAGLIEAPVFMAVLPQLCQHLLGEPLLIPSIATWWCQDAKSREYVFDHLDRLVIKPAFHASGGDEFIGSDLTRQEIDKLRKSIEEKPYNFVAQEFIKRSAVPTMGSQGELQAGHVALRAFAVASDDKYHVMPGGLVRVAETSGPMELSIVGGETSKDLWVLCAEADRSDSLLPAEHRNVELKRTTAKFPSRVADDLFWLGQSIERCDLLARLFRTLIARVETAEDNDGETQLLLRALVDVGGIEPGYAVQDIAAAMPRLPDAIVPMVKESSNQRGLFHTASELLRLASIVRDWISPETSQQLHRSGDEFLEAATSINDYSQVPDCLHRLVISLASSLGLIENGMIRGPAWRFLDLGRRIERTRTTALFVKSTLDTLHAQMLKIVIDVCDCSVTYRTRYLDDVQQNAVFDLCVTDVTNPRSVLYQVESIADHVDQLPHSGSEALRNAEKRLAMSAVHQVRMLTSDELGASDPEKLRSVLSHVESTMQDLANLLERKYLLHSGTPRQIVDSGEIVT